MSSVKAWKPTSYLDLLGLRVPTGNGKSCFEARPIVFPITDIFTAQVAELSGPVQKKAKAGFRRRHGDPMTRLPFAQGRPRAVSPRSPSVALSLSSSCFGNPVRRQQKTERV